MCECECVMCESVTHCGVSSVDGHAMRACVDEDGAHDVGRGEDGGVQGNGRGTVLIAGR